MLTKIYPEAPDYHLLTELVDELRRGAIFIYPTASGYAYCCDALHQRAIEELCRLKKIDPKKKALSIACASLSQVSEYCKMNDRAFKFIKEHEVNYTFILPASGALPRIFKQRKEVGVRLTQHPIGRLLAEHLGNPLITSSLPVEDEAEPEYCTNPELIEERYGHSVYTVLDAGEVPLAPSTIVDCTEEPFEVLRYGHGRLADEEPLLQKDSIHNDRAFMVKEPELIAYYTDEDVEAPRLRERILRNWIREVAALYNRRVGELCYQFCGDERILQTNQDFLDHDYYTDIITFDESEGDVISGDMLISLETVRSNAELLGNEYAEELHRVIIHGVLHLCGLKDKTPEDEANMRAAEDQALRLLHELLGEEVPLFD